MDFGVGGGDIVGLRNEFLLPEVARFVPEQIEGHTKWTYGRPSYWPPHDHCTHNGNWHLHTTIDFCASFPAVPPGRRVVLRRVRPAIHRARGRLAWAFTRRSA